MKDRLDNRFALETAEGIDILLTPAGLGVRSMAFTIDLLLRGVIIFAASMVLGSMDRMGSGMMLIVIFTVEWFYPVIFEVFKGATPGKSRYGLSVVYDNGLPVTLPGSLIRNLFRAIDILPFGYVSGAVCLMLSRRNKRIGDHLAGTMVVYQDKTEDLKQFSFEKMPTEQLSLTLEQQNAIVLFAERGNQLSPQRQQELANILYPLLGCKDEEAVEKLKTLAAGMVGKI